MKQVNPISLENRRTGTAEWRLDNPADNHEIEGYASATSINRGESIHLYVSTVAASYRYEIYRMGWYQGLGARLIRGPVREKGIRQKQPTMDPESGLNDCAWIDPVAISTTVSPDGEQWVSGIYLVKLTESASHAQSYIVFVVRDDERAVGLLFQQSVTTYQAYNNWGGKSFYKWNSTDNRRASKVSFNRPYAGNQQNPAAAYGIGAGEFLCNVQPHNDSYPIKNAGWEYNLVRWLEREGYDVAYCTNLDVHDNPCILNRCRGFLSVGHDEYWSWEMRHHLEHATDCGMHLGVFSANSAYWQVRLEASTQSGQDHRIMVCHKSAKRDCYSRSETLRHLSTGKWRDDPVNKPESAFIGVLYEADPVDGDIVIADAEHWLFENTELKNGDHLVGLLGYEVDCCDRHSPAGIQILTKSPWGLLHDSACTGYAHTTIYRKPQGAWIFAAGTMQWSWGLDDFNAPELRPVLSDPAVEQATRNLFMRFLEDANNPPY
jgi:hypothetical protein